jgi:hypothetical protein
VQLDAVAAAVLDAPARLRGSRLVCIDGRAGAGKTVLAADLADACSAVGPVTTIHMDDLYDGWSGCRRQLTVVIDQLLEPWTGRQTCLAGDLGLARSAAAAPRAGLPPRR